MVRLNNKDFSEEQLELLLKKCSYKIAIGDLEDEAIKALVEGMIIEDGEEKPYHINWDFKFNIFFEPKSLEDVKTIKQAMRSPSVNETIKERFLEIVRFEINAYLTGLKVHCTTDET